MNRSARLAGYIALGIAGGMLVATLVIMLLTRSDWGMERARRFAVSWLEDRVEGELTIGRVTGPGLLGGVVIHDFGIVDPRGRPFLSSDSMELAYDWRSLLAGRIVLNRVVLHRPSIFIERLPGDTLWNFEHIFGAPEPGAPEQQRNLILFDDARVANGLVVLRMPWEPDGPVEPGDTARLVLEPAPGGMVRTMRFEDVNARLNRVIWESPIERGRLFDIQSLQARGYVWREPMVIRDARGTVTARDSVIAFDLPELVMPGSEAGLLGRIVMRTGSNDIDMRVDARRVVFRDMLWLYPNLPDDGGGSFTLRVQSQPDGILWLAENAQLRAPGTNVAGSVGIVTGDSLYFTQVDLRASPLDVQTLEQILPGGLPVDGLLVGTIEVRGPLSALETHGDLRLAGRGGGSSAVAWDGVLDVRNLQDPRALSLRADVKHLELALLHALNPSIATGSVRGTVEGSGRLTALRFAGQLEHTARGGAQSRFDGRGTVQGAGRGRRFDLTLLATSATIQDLATMVPALEGMAGELQGPVHLFGTADEFEFDAALATPGGDLDVRAQVTRSAPGSRVRATIRTSEFRLHALQPAFPEGAAAGVFEVDVDGTGLDDFAGTVQMQLDSARFGALPIGRVTAGGRLADGVLTVDSASVLTVAGIGRVHGSIGLVAGRSGQLEAGFLSESLTTLEEHLMGARAADDEPRLAGRLDALVAVTGWLGSLDVDGHVRGESLVFRGSTASRMQAAVSGTFGDDVGGLRVAVTADSVVAFSHPLQQARLELLHTQDSMAVTVQGSAAGEEKLHVRATLAGDGEAGGVLRLLELHLGGSAPWRLAAPADVLLDHGVAHVENVQLVRAEGGRAVAAGRLAWAEAGADVASPIDFGVTLTGMPFTELLRFARSREEGAGEVEARLRVTGRALDPIVEGELAARDIVYGDVHMDRAYAELSYAGLGIDLHAEAQHDGRSILTAGGRIPYDLRLAAVQERRRDEPLRLTITADSLPPALPLGMLDGFSNAAGRIDGTVSVAGTTLEPTLSGSFTLRNGTADWDVTGVRYGDVNGEFVLENERLLRIDVRAQAADPRARPGRTLTGAPTGGAGAVTGTLEFVTLTDPAFDLRMSASRAYAARRRDVEASVTGDVHLGGRYSRPEVSGSLRVEHGTLNVDELYRQYLIVGLELDDPGLLMLVDTSLVAVRPLLAASTNPFLRNLQIRNLQVAVGNESWIRSQDMDVEVTGNLNISFDRRDEDLRMLGSLNVERGTYTLYYPPLQSRRFQVREGTIVFPGTPGIDPNMTITAAYRARANNEPLDILAVVSGTLQNPRVRLASDAQPPISESDLASYLFFGVPTWEVANTGVGGADVRAVAGLGVRAIGPSVLGYASSGLQTLVQNAGLLDYVSLTAAEASAADRAAPGLTSFLAGTQLEIGRYLGPDLFVGYSQRLGATTYDPAMRLEWRFRPEYSLEMFAEDRFARLPGFGLRSEPGLRKVYGFSLFREWGF
ncbi:MAG TPA: translocation/assembly module TamB domain-containing protein [Longimicrobiales bacterium]|nr:translocation/assembly module TamB domain-containing protein [Longimicrobiales bacterium]